MSTAEFVLMTLFYCEFDKSSAHSFLKYFSDLISQTKIHRYSFWRNKRKTYFFIFYKEIQFNFSDIDSD